MDWERFKNDIVRLENYFNTGMGKLQVVKYISYIVAIGGGITGALNYSEIVLMAVGVAVVSVLFGYVWDKKKMYFYEKEFSNRRDWFVQEMREKFNGK